jgi:hypothetical protein
MFTAQELLQKKKLLRPQDLRELATKLKQQIISKNTSKLFSHRDKHYKESKNRDME